IALISFLTLAGLSNYGIQETAASELVFDWVPGEGEGMVDEVPFNQLPTAMITYDSATDTFTHGDPAQLSEASRQLFEEFKEDVSFWKEHDPNFKNSGSAALTIAPWQLDQQGNIRLEKVTLQLTVEGKQQTPSVRFISSDKDKPAQ